MCGRYTLTVKPEDLKERFHLDSADATSAPRFNVAPTQDVPVVLNESPTRLSLVQWGLIPSWAKDPGIGAQLINARAETVAEKPSFRNAFKKRRCLVLADSFYEWRKDGEGSRPSKTPLRITLKAGEPFAMAGLWEVWTSPEGEKRRTCTIITTEANDLLASIHDRMPVILPPDQELRWLDDNLDAENLKGLLQPYPSNLLSFYEVSRRVNATQNDDPSVIDPVKALL
jgi:putative SOS response-associated peptidase YedK